MAEQHILYPVFALAALTLGVALWMGRLRFAAVRRGDLNARYYELNRGGKPPAYLLKVSQNYDNLLELPILFYVVVLLLLVTEHVESGQVVLAWLFAGFRYIHTAIHTTSNNVRQRMLAFLASSVMLIAMWGLFFVRVVQS